MPADPLPVYRQPLYWVGLKHGEDVGHDGIVSALLDILDCYTNEDTEVVVFDRIDAARIVGPNRTANR